jgi:transposase-like protein
MMPRIAESNRDALPPAKSIRWTRRRKAAVVLAVTSGRLTISEACHRYQISVDEFVEWQRQFEGGRRVRWTGATR